jgi:hypothetical protein
MDSFCRTRINNSKISTYNDYIQKFNPELVIDLATLTGAAAAAIGK